MTGVSGNSESISIELLFPSADPTECTDTVRPSPPRESSTSISAGARACACAAAYAFMFALAEPAAAAAEDDDEEDDDPPPTPPAGSIQVQLQFHQTIAAGPLLLRRDEPSPALTARLLECTDWSPSTEPQLKRSPINASFSLLQAGAPLASLAHRVAQRR